MLNQKSSFNLNLGLENTLVKYPGDVEELALCLSLQQSLPSIIGGVILFDEHDRLIFVNSMATEIIQKISQNSHPLEDMPAEIDYIKKIMVEAKKRFPHQSWLYQSTIFTECLTVFQVHARWIQDASSGQNYLLLKMEDQNQFSQNLALEEAKRLGLTLREQEVWLLHRSSYTYKQIAEALKITPNTVKKHMKSILVKQRSVEG